MRIEKENAEPNSKTPNNKKHKAEDDIEYGKVSPMRPIYCGSPAPPRRRRWLARDPEPLTSINISRKLLRSKRLEWRRIRRRTQGLLKQPLLKIPGKNRRLVLAKFTSEILRS
jgi:hypothetical protein